jgi:mRNA interferase MazF
VIDVNRGDLVTAVFFGAYGNPRPALVVQGDAFAELPSVTVLPLTTDLQPAPLIRITVEADAENGLERRSQIMIDKAATMPRGKIGRRLGRVDAGMMEEVGRALGLFLGIG